MLGIVEEFQGLYGPVQVTERFLQILWKRQAFHGDRFTCSDGRSFRTIHPGQWNKLEGPDFRDAVLEVDGVTVTGDVEIHFYSKDWNAHGHQVDPNYNGVMLHVVLFDGPELPVPALTESGRELPGWAMLPHLIQDLESLAEEEAMREGEAHAFLEEWQSFHDLAFDAQRRCLEDNAKQRWHQKVCRARYLIEELGWEEALHLQTLEVLGYARNRSQMTTLGKGIPFRQLKEGGFDGNQLFDYQRGLWQLSGIRPANHPRTRLQQYSKLVQYHPDWPRDTETWIRSWLNILKDWKIQRVTTSQLRSRFQFKPQLLLLQNEVLGGLMGGNRIHNWVADALLPLGAAHLQIDLWMLWFNWYSGDTPREALQIETAFRSQGDGTLVRCNGWIQGILSYLIRIRSGWVQLDFNALPENWGQGGGGQLGKPGRVV